MSIAARLKQQIDAHGPMPLETFLEQVMSRHPDSYYSAEDRFGKDGDFITAPEISQLFGEVIAAFLAWLWEVSGRPQADEMMLFEAGPGRGTLFADMHRTWARIRPQMAAAPITFLEASPALQTHIKKRFSGMDVRLTDDVAGLPEVPAFGVANEFFDALAIRQAVRTQAGWVWRMVGHEADRFVMQNGASVTEDEQIKRGLAADAAIGSIAEFSPASEEIMARLARHVARFGGGIVICDYGKTGPQGDSLQGVRGHKAVPVLDQPGNTDISHLVDFAALADVASAQGARLIGPVGQGAFLRELGIEARADALRRPDDPAGDRALAAALERLCAPEQMGQIFKVALLVPAGDGLPAGFASLADGAVS